MGLGSSALRRRVPKREYFPSVFYLAKISELLRQKDKIVMSLLAMNLPEADLAIELTQYLLELERVHPDEQVEVIETLRFRHKFGKADDADLLFAERPPPLPPNPCCPSHASLDSLPDDVLAQIASNLTHARDIYRLFALSRRWARLATSCTRLCLAGAPATPAGMAALLRRVPHACTLRLAPCSDLPLCLAELARIGPTLRCLDLRGLGSQAADDECLTAFLRACPVLQALKLAPSARTTHASLALLPKHCAGLLTLTAGAACLEDAGLGALAACQSLGALRLTKCRRLTAVGIARFASEAPPSLRALRFTEACSVAHEAWPQLAQLVARLERVDLSIAVHLDDAALTALPPCPRLQRAAFGYCDQLTDDAVLALCRAAPGLTALDLRGCVRLTEVSLRACAGLERLEIGECTGMRPIGLTSLEPGHRLRTLSLASLPQCSDARLCALIAPLARLRTLSLANCRLVGDPTLWALGRACPGLRRLNLAACGGVSDDGVLPLARGCPQLRSLNLSHLARLTDASAVAVAAHCPRLQTLAVRRCSLFTDHALRALARRSVRLQRLDAAGCMLLSDEGALRVARGCTQLTHIDLSHCRHVTGVALCALCSCCPDLTRVVLVGCRVAPRAVERLVAAYIGREVAKRGCFALRGAHITEHSFAHREFRIEAGSPPSDPQTDALLTAPFADSQAGG